MRLTSKIVIASTNLDKFEEFKALFSAYPDIELIPAGKILRNAGNLGSVENHDTYFQNALAKARLANLACHFPCLADDSGIECDALNGRPGVRSARFSPPVAGLSQDEANTRLLLKETGTGSRNARFVCTLVLIIEGIMLHATGKMEGNLIDTPRGTLGFGYDPIFVPRGSSKTLAEMTQGEKNSISHRAKALHDLMTQAKNHGIVLAKP